VATLQTLARTLTVPGLDGATEIVAADALTSVTVAATHRRRGLLTQMIGRSLAAARERGDPVSVLIAAEWPIYGRFGYAPATELTRRVLHRERPGATVAGDLTRVRMVDLDEFLALAPAVFAAARRRRAGQVDRDPPWWDIRFARDGFPTTDPRPHNYVVHDGDDGPDGLLAWTSTREGGMRPPRGAVNVDLGPCAVDDAAHRDLWAYLSGLDGVDEITVHAAVDDPIRWLLGDGRTLQTLDTHDYLWLRLLDVPRALAARRYATAGEIVLEVTDPTPVSAGGRYRLRADGDAVSCEPTDAAPDLGVTQPALAAAYLGGVTLREQRIAGSVSEHRRGALQRADAMFATALAPFNETGF
jgi:predicted acetyltransferase